MLKSQFILINFLEILKIAGNSFFKIPTFLLWSSKYSIKQVWYGFKFILLLSGHINVDWGPITVNKKNILLNILPFYNCDEPSMLYKCNSCGCYNEHSNIIASYNLYLNIKSVLLKTNENCLIVKQSNTSILGCNESKLDPSKQWKRYWIISSSKDEPFKEKKQSCTLF